MKKMMCAIAVALAGAAAVVMPVQSFAKNGPAVSRPAPPAPRHEAIPAARKGYEWAPGYWEWKGKGYTWVKGHWERSRPGYTYRHAEWRQGPKGWELDRGGWHK